MCCHYDTTVELIEHSRISINFKYSAGFSVMTLYLVLLGPLKVQSSLAVVG